MWFTATVYVTCRRLVQNCSNITELNLTGCRRITNVYAISYIIIYILISMDCYFLFVNVWFGDHM